MKRLFIILLMLISSVLQAAVHHVAATGGDFATIAEVNAHSFADDDQILFNRGETFYGTLTITHSSTLGHPIILGAYGTGANPIITGLTTLSGWTDETGGIYSKVIVSDAQTNMVTIDGVQYGMGRYPNSGWLTYESSTTNVSITDNELSGTPDWTGAGAVIKINAWSLDRCLITNHSETTLTYTNLGSNLNASGNENTYFIQNDLRTLDNYGEWYHDYSGTGKFYMYFGAVDPTTKVVKVATKNNVIVNWASYITIDGLDLFGCIDILFSSSDPSRSNININNSTISFSGSDAIKISGNYYSLENNIINNCNRIGISTNGSNGNIINNTISNLGTIVGQAKYGGITHGIFLNGSTYLIQYNHFENIYAEGIVFAANNNNINIRNNFIENTCIGFTDAGAIYTYGNHSSVLIDGNIIETSGGNGIYLDESCNGVTVSNNTVTECVGNGIKLHKAYSNSIVDNTCFDNGCGLDLVNGSAVSNIIQNDSIYGNKFIAKAATQYTAIYWNTYSGYAASFPTLTLDYNYYARPIDDNLTFGTYLVSTWGAKTFAQWKTLIGQDANSHKSPISVADTALIDFYYNTTLNNRTVNLPVPMIDVTGTKYTTLIIIPPFSSAILMPDPSPGGVEVNSYPLVSGGKVMMSGGKRVVIK